MLLELLLPTRCVVCRRVGVQLCDACLARLPRLRPPWCERCAAPTAWPVRRCTECRGRRLAFAQARAAVEYDEAVRAAVGAWKERGLRRLVRAFADVAAAELARPENVLTFVPSDPERRRERAGHPAEALARELGLRWRLEVVDLLARRPGRRQRALPYAARRANVRGSFTARAAPRRVVLVDDVYTTGATVNEAASALRRAGARQVEVLTFARAVRAYTVRSQA